MAIRAGQILHDVNGYVIDRIQTGGPGALNIPEEKIFELGNYKTVGIVRDIPDLTFDLESVDVSTEFESILLSRTPKLALGQSGDEFNFDNDIPIDVISPFKSSKGNFDIVRGLAIPCLSLERVMYRFGVRQSAMQSFTLRGDSIYYIPGVPHYEEIAYTGGANFDVDYTFPGATDAPSAVAFNEQGNTFYTLSVSLINKNTGTYKRLFFGPDGYTEPTAGPSTPATGFTIPADYGTGTHGYTHVRFTYGSDSETVAYTQGGYSPTDDDALHKVHQGRSVKPAAVRGKDIKIYISPDPAGGATTWQTFRGVQTVEVTRSVNLEPNEELGNHHYASQEWITPDVRGTLGVRPIDTADLWRQIYAITGVTEGEVVGPQTVATVQMKAEILDPDNGSVIKSIYVPDARFQVPGINGRANQKLDTTFTFSSDTGSLSVFDGEM